MVSIICNESKCTNELLCMYCAGSHKYENCPDKNTIKCGNCKYNCEKYKIKKDINHLPNDTVKCTILKNKINRLLTTTNYPFLPELPRYINNINKQKKEEKKN